MKIGSLFSGYGGLDLAVSKVTGAKVAWHCEWEDAPSKVLEAHFPGVPNYRDVSKVNWEAVEPVDILTGGFPCQDLSLAGKRAGLQEGTRSGLWSEFYKAITIIKPKLVVIENVRGLLSAKADSGMEYGTEVMEQARGGGHLFEHWELFSGIWPTSGMTQSGLAFELQTRAHRTKDLGSSSLPTPQVDDHKNTGHNERRRATLASVVYQETNWIRFQAAFKRWEEVIGRPAPAPTRPDGKENKNRLNPLFAEWLMGIPEGWITGLGLKRNDELKLAGNGVVPQQAELALRILLKDDNLLERIKE